ncbi:MAG: TlpA disulfide reductase family protein, partial [Anaerovoracaceae bacterium]
MKSIAGNDFAARGDASTITDKDLGFGIKLTDTMLKYKEEDNFVGAILPPYSALFTISTEEGKALTVAANSLSDEEYAKKSAELGKTYFDQFGVFRYEKGAEGVENSFEEWKAYFSEIEELCVYSGSTYYFAYNKDYSDVNANQKDQEVFDQLISELQTVRDNICIFPPVTEKVTFTGNLNQFEAPTLGGEKVNQDSFKEYDITMVNIWATWCGPCVEELPEIGKLYEQLPKNVNLISICTDAEEERELATEILEKSNSKFTTLIGNDALDKSLLKQIDSLPTTVFVDSKGNVVGEVQVGPPGASGEITDAYMKIINEKLTSIGK